MSLVVAYRCRETELFPEPEPPEAEHEASGLKEKSLHTWAGFVTRRGEESDASCLANARVFSRFLSTQDDDDKHSSFPVFLFSQKNPDGINFVSFFFRSHTITWSL